MSKTHLVNRANNTAICGNKGTDFEVTTHPVEVTCGRCKMVAAARAKAAKETKVQAAKVQAAKEQVAEVPATEVEAKPGRCECSHHYYQVGQHLYTTNCHKAPTGKRSRFAQGHDQKLVSLRKAAAAAGAEIKRWGE